VNVAHRLAANASARDEILVTDTVRRLLSDPRPALDPRPQIDQHPVFALAG